MRADSGHRFVACCAGVVFAAALALHLSGAEVFPHQFVVKAGHPIARSMPSATPMQTAHLPDRYFWLSRDFAPGDPRLIDVVGAGDVMMGSRDQGLDPDIDAEATALAKSGIADVFRRADVSFVNLEATCLPSRTRSSTRAPTS